MDRKTLAKAAEYRTPLYVFDKDILKETVKRFRRIFAERAELCFAMKTNPFVVKEMESMTDRIEVCSMGEFAICREMQIKPEKILVSGVLKEKEELYEILEKYRNSCMYTVESLNQYYDFEHWCQEKSQVIHVFLRLTSGNQFGMDQETIRKIIERSKESPFLKIRGIHYFSGTQKRSVSKIQKELEKLDGFLMDLRESCGFEAEELEYGPGMPVSYFDPEKEITDRDLMELAETISKMEFRGKLTLEMGRAFAADCGYYLTRIMDVKSSDGRNFCIVDGGIHQLNYDGQIRGMYCPPLEILAEQRTGEEKLWTVCGSLCTVNDVLIQKLPLTDPKPGDVLVFKRAGAYSVMEGMSLFLSHSLPKVFLYGQEEGFKLMRKAHPTYKWNMEDK